MELTNQCRIRPMTMLDLHCVFAWRNAPEIKYYMLTQHEISFVEHAKWFEKASQDPQKHLMIVEDGNYNFGFVQFNGTGKGNIADWGFYIAPGAPKGSGQKLGVLALNYAFKSIGFHKVCGQALSYNEGSIRFHHKMGFKKEGVLRDQHRIGNIYHDIICFGLLNKEWVYINIS